MIAVNLSIADLERLKDEFATYMRGTGKSVATIRIYMWGIQSLIRHVRTTEAKVVSPESLETWDRLVLGAMKSPKSRAIAVTGVRQCLMWAADKGEADYRLARVVPNIKYPRKDLPSTLSPGAMMKVEYLLETRVEENPKDVRRLRDRALYFSIKSTASKVNEILQVRRKNFKGQVVRQRAGNLKELTFPPGVAKLIREYLSARDDDNEWLWVAYYPSGRIARLDEDGVLKIWERLAKKAGIARFTTQELRNTAATLLVGRGHEDGEVMRFLGLQDIRSLQGYKAVVEDKQARLRADLDVPY